MPLNLSSIVIAGHLGRDAEMKSVGDNAVCEFSVAVTTKARGGESTAWYRCALWGKRGASLHPHLTKGKAVIVVGDLVPREWKTKQDELRTSLDVNVGSLTFAGGGGGGHSSADTGAAPVSNTSTDDDSIPF